MQDCLFCFLSFLLFSHTDFEIVQRFCRSFSAIQRLLSILRLLRHFDCFVTELDQKKFVLPHPPNDKAKNYFVYSCILAWNRVPDALKRVTIFSAFTRNLKGHLLGEPIENNIHINNNIRNNTSNVNRTNNNSNSSNNSSGIRVLQWVRPSGRPNANAQNPPFASRWDNQLRNF